MELKGEFISERNSLVERITNQSNLTSHNGNLTSDENNKEYEEMTVDLSNQKLKKLERANTEQQSATELIVDNNELQKLDNMDSYSHVKKLSAANNQIHRMYWVCNLIYLQELNLSNNSIATIEGLRDLKHLRVLNLAKNKLKAMGSLNTLKLLERIDLSVNNITHITDLSALQNLKTLHLHFNSIYHLRHLERNLPVNLEYLTLHNNLIEDLNEISHLVHLLNLKELSVRNNPCVKFPDNQKFNYRPFVKNWCSSITTLDDVLLNDIECLKAEWLYSQGRGRSFRTGEHSALIEYLHSVCPREGEEDRETEDVKKLKLILSKAQQHQKQLREQLSSGQFPVKDSSKFALSKKKSTLGPERMVASFQEHPHKESRNSQELMTRSLDSGISKNSPVNTHRLELKQPLETSTTFLPLPDTLISPDVGPTCAPRGSSLSSRTSRSSSRNSPHSTPESKRKTPTRYLMRHRESESPVTTTKPGSVNSRGSTPLGSSRSRNTPSPAGIVTIARETPSYLKETSEDDDSEGIALRVKAVQHRANQRKQKVGQWEPKRRNVGKAPEIPPVNSPEWKAAVCIQSRWRGYRARNLNKDVLSACSSIQMSRMQAYITKVMTDMEATRDALEKNRKLLVFHMQAIHGLWKKMTANQPAVSGKEKDEKASVQSLVETCANLNQQVESLQVLVKTMQMSKVSSNPIATQTEIVAVNTPQGDVKDVFFVKPKESETSGETCPSCAGEEFLGNYEEADNFSTGTFKVDAEAFICREDLRYAPSEISGETFQISMLKKPNVKLQDSDSRLSNEDVTSKTDTEVLEPGNS